MKLRKICSGGQTGVDQAALMAALSVGYETGGWAPAGYETLTGPNPLLRDMFKLVEMTTSSYAARTRRNVEDTDGTIIYAANMQSAGTALTRRTARELGKPLLLVEMLYPESPDEVALWLEEHDIEVLNAAGNSEKTCPGIGKVAEDYFSKIFSLCKELAR